MSQVKYRCPHCQTLADVTPAKVGQVHDCPTCGRPFRPEVLIGRMMVRRDDGQWNVAGATGTEAPPLDEKPITTVYPTMFRANPLKFLALVLAFILGATWMLYFGAPSEGSGVENWWRPITAVLSILCAGVALVSLVWLIHWFLEKRFEYLAITNERAVWARGIFHREMSEIQHDDVRNIQTRQSLVDRILGVGRIAISSAGQHDMEIDIRGVPQPNDVADTVRSLQNRASDRND